MQKLEQYKFVEDSKNNPVRKFVSGPISATVWLNQAAGKDGIVNFRTVSFQRRYKAKDGKWQNSSTLRINDLPRASLVLQKAYEYLVMREINNSSGAYNSEEVVEEVI